MMNWFFKRKKLVSNKDDINELVSLSEISDIEFNIIVNHVAKKLKRIQVDKIRHRTVYCKAKSNSGISFWNFKVEFFKDKTGYYYSIFSDNDTSTLPDFLAAQIVKLLNKDIQSIPINFDSYENGRFCHRCGFKLEKEELFCTRCGAKTNIFEEEILLLKIEEEKSIQQRQQTKRDISADNLKRIQEKTRQDELAAEEVAKKRSFVLALAKTLAPVVIIIVIFFTLYSRMQNFFSNREHQSKGDIQLTFSSSDFDNQTERNKEEPVKYKSVEKDFKNAGFENIDLIKQKDVGWLGDKKDNVISVTINGDSDFLEGDWFPKDSKIKIVYHAKK